MTDATALLLVGHGTRSAAGVRQYWELAAGIGARAPGLTIGGGFIELAKPALDAAVDDLAERGMRTIVAVPLVLLGAGHMKDDGPAVLARARQRHPDLHFAYGRHLGIHPLVLDTAEQRARAAIGMGDPADWAVALIGRGSSDPDANSDLYKVARLLGDSRGFGLVEPGFVSLARPSVTDVLERCRRLGARRVAVVPYFLFTGDLVARIRKQAAAWERTHPGLEVRCGPELGPDSRIAALVLERHQEALVGAARMNCDCCIYRAPLPGYESLVARPVAVDRHDHDHDHGGR